MPRRTRNGNRLKTTTKDLNLNTDAAAGGYAAFSESMTGNPLANDRRL